MMKAYFLFALINELEMVAYVRSHRNILNDLVSSLHLLNFNQMVSSTIEPLLPAQSEHDLSIGLGES